jgi:hypothetical protein
MKMDGVKKEVGDSVAVAEAHEGGERIKDRDGAGYFMEGTRMRCRRRKMRVIMIMMEGTKEK